jgi:hypothetical protein
MNHKAIYKLYPQVTSIDDTVGAFDADGNTVVIDIDAVNAWVDPDQYKFDRATAYPTIQEQLDMQYWDGVNGTTIWADTVASVKSENPKP